MSKVNEIYILCNEKRYFTCGSNEQYNIMFDMVRNGAPANDIALVIFICSDTQREDVDFQTIKEEVEEIINSYK